MLSILQLVYNGRSISRSKNASLPHTKTPWHDNDTENSSQSRICSNCAFLLILLRYVGRGSDFHVLIE